MLGLDAIDVGSSYSVASAGRLDDELDDSRSVR